MKANRAISMRKMILAAVFFVVSLMSANAQSTKVSSPNNITYIGTVDEHVNFLLNYENETNEKYVMIVTDANGRVLFEEVYADKKLTKIYSVPVEYGNVTFTITAYKNKSDKKFQVTTERRLIEEVIVKKP
jgi:ssRNA-specific RNase YbeY (16S rRNA maturation enzyme)